MDSQFLLQTGQSAAAFGLPTSLVSITGELTQPPTKYQNVANNFVKQP